MWGAGYVVGSLMGMSCQEGTGVAASSSDTTKRPLSLAGTGMGDHGEVGVDTRRVQGPCRKQVPCMQSARRGTYARLAQGLGPRSFSTPGPPCRLSWPEMGWSTKPPVCGRGTFSGACGKEHQETQQRPMACTCLEHWIY